MTDTDDSDRSKMRKVLRASGASGVATYTDLPVQNVSREAWTLAIEMGRETAWSAMVWAPVIDSALTAGIEREAILGTMSPVTLAWAVEYKNRWSSEAPTDWLPEPGVGG